MKFFLQTENFCSFKMITLQRQESAPYKHNHEGSYSWEENFVFENMFCLLPEGRPATCGARNKWPVWFHQIKALTGQKTKKTIQIPKRGRSPTCKTGPMSSSRGSSVSESSKWPKSSSSSSASSRSSSVDLHPVKNISTTMGNSVLYT